MANKTDKILRFKEAFPSFDIFENEIIKPVQLLYPNAPWLDESKMYTSFETLYRLFIAKHGNKFLRYDFGQAVGILQLELVDKLPDLYVKQSIITDESLEKLTDFAERGFQTVTEGNVGGTDSPNNSGADIDIKNGENVTRKQKSKATSKSFNFVTDLTKLLETKVSTYMIDFLDMFTIIFVTAQIQSKLDVSQDQLLFESFFGKLVESLDEGSGITFAIDQTGEKIQIMGSNQAHMLNLNTNPSTETIKLEDNDIGGTYNLKAILDDLTAVRNQANAIGDHEFKDETGALISFDALNPKKVYTVEAIDAMIANIPLFDASLYRLKTEQDKIDAKTLADAKTYTDAEIDKVPTFDPTAYRTKVLQDVIDAQTLTDAKKYTNDEIGKLVNPFIADYELIQDNIHNGTEVPIDLTKPNDYLILRSPGDANILEAGLTTSYYEGGGFMFCSESTDYFYGFMKDNKLTFRGGESFPAKVYRRKEK